MDITPDVRVPLLLSESDESGDEAGTSHSTARSRSVSPQVPDFAPPAYDGLLWKGSRKIGSDLPELRDVPAYIETFRTTTDDPFAGNTVGPRSMRIPRDPRAGYGFSIAGGAPCHAAAVTAGGPADLQGLKRYDELLEINGVDVTTARIGEVGEKIQKATTHLTLVLVPGVAPEHGLDPLVWGDPYQSGLMELGAVDPTQRPNTHIIRSSGSLLCCPIVGALAVFQSMQVGVAWTAGNFTQARVHSLLAKKLSSSAAFFGCVIILFYLMVTAAPKGETHGIHNGGGQA